MKSRQIVRAALVVGGIWMIVSSLSTAASTTAWGIMNSASLENPIRDGLILSAISALFSLLLGVAPGLLVIRRSERWANRLAPSDNDTADIRPELILIVGLKILGISIAVSGFAVVAGTGFAVLGISEGGIEIPVQLMQNFYSSLLSFVAGVAIIGWARSFSRAA